ncbi:MAG: hypothetical protein V3V50_03825 [Gammaproteobacteria bacterium]
MKRALLTLFTPPIAVCKFGCASFCAAPIAVFWLAGIGGIIYGLVGGPANLMGPSWNTVLLGFGLWGIATVWAAVAIRGADADNCAHQTRSRVCGKNTSTSVNQNDETDPFDEIRKAR